MAACDGYTAGESVEQGGCLAVEPCLYVSCLLEMGVIHLFGVRWKVVDNKMTDSAGI